MGYLGGQYNYHERVLRKSERPFSGDKKLAPSNQKGDIVYVQFVGRTSNPMIVGLGTHFLDKDTTGAIKSDGHKWVEEYNGVNRHINKSGEFELIRKGGTLNTAKGYFVPADRAADDGLEPPEELFQARFRLSDNVMLWEDPNNSIEFKKNELLYTHIVGKSETNYKEVIDGINEQTLRTYKSGLTITEDGINDKMNISLGSGVTVDIDGKAGTITLDSTGGNSIVIDKSGTMTITASGIVKIDAPLVDVGESASFSSTLFENLLTEFAKHTHPIPGNVGPPVTEVPSAPLISLVGSSSVKIKE